MWYLRSLPITPDPSRILQVQRKLSLLQKKKTPIGYPTHPPFVRHAKQTFNALVNKYNNSFHGHIQIKKNNAMLDPVETKNNNQSKKEGQESDVEIVMESNNVTSIVVPVDSLPAHE